MRFRKLANQLNGHGAMASPHTSKAPEHHLSGAAIRKLMRAHHKTIRGLAKSMNVTMKRVREVRAEGVSTEIGVWEWTEWITKGQLRL